MASLSGAKRRARACTGKPVVGMLCFTPCLTFVQEKVGCSISGNFCRISRNLSYPLSIGANSSTEKLLTEQGEDK